MASELQHIDDFFRKKGDTLSADVSSADLHWQQMKEVLGNHVSLPAKKPVVSRLRPLMKYAAVVTIVSSLMYVVTTKPWKEKTKPSTTSLPAIATVSPAKTRPVTPGSRADQAIPYRPLAKRVAAKSIPKHANTILPATGYSSDSTAHKTITDQDNAAVFSSFYNELKKPAEKFIIDTGKDTTIYCKEGSTLYIPASCFQSLSGTAISGLVNVYVQEFYSIADIVGNKLSTMSDSQALVTGGMLNIQALTGDQQVVIKPGMTIRLDMPAKQFDPNMQLFTGTIEPQNVAQLSIDSASGVKENRNTGPGTRINWIQQGQRQFFIKENKKNITILNLTDNPDHVVSRGNKTIGKFVVPFDCKLSTEQAKQELEKRYGKYYDRIKVKRQWKPLFRKKRELKAGGINDWFYTHLVGDTITIPLWIARRRGLVSREDSLAYEAKWRKQFEDAQSAEESYSEFLQVKNDYGFEIRNNYSFEIRKLGWINCDRFTKYSESRMVDFSVTSDDEFKGTYFEATLLVDKRRTAIQGYWQNGTVYFPSRLPVGEAVNVICVGARKGKVYCAVQKLIVNKGKLYQLRFQETTPSDFKNKLSHLRGVE